MDLTYCWYIYARRSAQQVLMPYHEPYMEVFTPLLAEGKEAELKNKPMGIKRKNR